MTQSVHLIGIGGSGMKGLARLLRGRGFRVSGSDVHAAPSRAALEGEGIRVCAGHNAANLPDDAARVIISRAIPEHNPELVEARRRGLPIETYSRGLGRLLREHRGHGIGVAGTHGKTSTCAWLAWILLAAGRDPSFVIGGDIEALGGNMRAGNGSEFVVEACEYGGSFHDLHPRIGVILNVEDDHAECYGGRAEGVYAAFGRFARGIPADGKLIVDAGLLGRVREWEVRARVIPVETTGSGTVAAGYALDRSAAEESAPWVLRRDGEPVVELASALPGRFSAINLAFAAVVALEVGTTPAAVAAAAPTFGGVKRRFEDLGTHGGVTVIDDYAHHPTEVGAVVRAARTRYAGRPLTVVFEPHQYRRLQTYLGDFARELAGADRVFVTSVFAARERPEEWRDIAPDHLVQAICGRRGRAHYVELDGAATAVRGAVESGDVVMALGAGRSTEVAHELVRSLR